MELSYKHLLGKQFEFGKSDCFALARQFFDENFGIKVRNYARPSDWDPEKLDLIDAAFANEGFEKVSNWSLATLRPGDVLCLALGAKIASHFAIYIGDNLILHHMNFGLSKTEPLRGFWRDRTCYVLRHPDVPDLRPTLPSIDIRDLIDARNRIQTPA